MKYANRTARNISNIVLPVVRKHDQSQWVVHKLTTANQTITIDAN